jgi:hypothetical protein
MRKISNWVKFNEEINIGNVKPFEITNKLYKLGDYICSSFEYNDLNDETITVIVAGILIDKSDIKLKTPSRHYKILNDYLSQFNVNPDEYLHIGFSEYKDGIYNDDKNSNNPQVIFRKMATIIEIIKSFIDHFNNDKVIYTPVENDMESGLNRPYNKRDSFYNLFLNHYNISYKYIKNEFIVQDTPIKNFFVLNI